MILATRKSRIVALFSALLIVTAGCSPNTSISSGPSSASLPAPPPSPGPVDRSEIVGVVALERNQFMQHEWAELDWPARKNLLQRATITTIQPGHILRKKRTFKKAFKKSSRKYLSEPKYAGEWTLIALALSPAFVALDALAMSTVGEISRRKSITTVELVRNSRALRRTPAPVLLNKNDLAAAIKEQIIHYAQRNSNIRYIEVPYETANQPSQWPERADTLLTVRVKSLGFIAKGDNDPQASIFIHAVANLDQHTSWPIEYVSGRRALSQWTANDAHHLR